MDFFQEVDGLGVSELHISRLMRLQQGEVEKVIEVYQRVRDTLRQRLVKWMAKGEDRFTTQRLRGVLMQVEEALTALESKFLQRMFGAAKDTSIFSVEHLKEEIQKYESHFRGGVLAINLDALTFANEQANFLIEQYEVSMDRWSVSTRSRIEASLQEGIAMEQTPQEMITRLMDNWGAYEWELRRIVRTELHNVYNTSKIRGMVEVSQRQVPDLMKALLHPLDRRTAEDSKQLADLNPILPLHEPFRYTYRPSGSFKAYPRQFMAPPDRPNDRAILIPYRSAWDNGKDSLFANVAAPI